jgi:hypothetical protein
VHFYLANICLVVQGCALSMNANGPAIWGGCITRRSIRAGSWYFSQKTVTVQGGDGALFAVMVQILLNAGAIAVQF